jgi:hypothetical protein
MCKLTLNELVLEIITPVVINNIPYELDIDKIIKIMHINDNSDDYKNIMRMIDDINNICNPKAVYKASLVHDKSEDIIKIDNSVFKSSVLRKNLDKVRNVFPYVVTCGSELDSIIISDDLLELYWFDYLKSQILESAVLYLKNHLKNHYKLKNIATMRPGTGNSDIWPIQQQTVLFELLGDVKDSIGVELTESMLMIPTKTVSGIFFSSIEDYDSCMVCQNNDCPARRVNFNKDMFNQLSN